MVEQAITIIQFMAESFLHIWPYLLLTIPLAVAVQMSGAARFINRALTTRPMLAIFLATIVGAFSPFCSCGVIPVIAALLIAGVPLAPVMAFWIASPSMDPEIFFLSAGMLGWKLAVWRLASTMVLSLSAGVITHYALQRGWLGRWILRENYSTNVRSNRALLRAGWGRVTHLFRQAFWPVMVKQVAYYSMTSPKVEAPTSISTGFTGTVVSAGNPTCADRGCTASTCEVRRDGAQSCEAARSDSLQAAGPAPFWRRLLAETTTASMMVVKFMGLAFFLEALITLYIPADWIMSLVGPQNPFAILTAAVLGVPFYTSNLAALPMINGLLQQGMDPAAALAFLVAGPTTTLPAMAAVWGLASRRVFVLYVSFSLLGALLAGFFYSLM